MVCYSVSMSKYDAIIILASQPDVKTWEFPDQIYEGLDKSIELFNKGVSEILITSGDHSISLENRGIMQPFKECDKLAEYLVEHGIPTSSILTEGDSRDTISNLYYLKTKFFIPKNMKRLLFVVADFRIPRLKFLCEKILGKQYDLNFEPIVAEQGESYNEPHTMKIQSEFLAPMKSGDHEWLDGKFYNASMYQYWAKHDRQKYG